MTKLATILLAALALAGCDKSPLEYIGLAQGYAAKAAAKGIVGECSVSEQTRCENFQAIVDELAKDQRPERPMPLDCDGNGVSDAICPLPE